MRLPDPAVAATIAAAATMAEAAVSTHCLGGLKHYSIEFSEGAIPGPSTIGDALGGLMSLEHVSAVEWDGTTLVGWVMINGRPVKVSADRDTIHRYAAGFNDALTWEIERHCVAIFEKLVPFFVATYK